MSAATWSHVDFRLRRFVGENEREESLAVLLDLHRAHAANLSERVRRLRAAHRHLGERAIGNTTYAGTFSSRAMMRVRSARRRSRAPARRRARRGDLGPRWLRRRRPRRRARFFSPGFGLPGRRTRAPRSSCVPEAVVAAAAILARGRDRRNIEARSRAGNRWRRRTAASSRASPARPSRAGRAQPSRAGRR